MHTSNGPRNMQQHVHRHIYEQQATETTSSRQQGSRQRRQQASGIPAIAYRQQQQSIGSGQMGRAAEGLANNCGVSPNRLISTICVKPFICEKTTICGKTTICEKTKRSVKKQPSVKTTICEKSFCEKNRSFGEKKIIL